MDQYRASGHEGEHEVFAFLLNALATDASFPTRVTTPVGAAVAVTEGCIPRLETLETSTVPLWSRVSGASDTSPSTSPTSQGFNSNNNSEQQSHWPYQFPGIQHGVGETIGSINGQFHMDYHMSYHSHVTPLNMNALTTTSAGNTPQLSPIEPEHTLEELEGKWKRVRLTPAATATTTTGGSKTKTASISTHRNNNNTMDQVKIIRACQECGKTYTTREGLRLHMRASHLDDKQHFCHVCGMRFVRGGDLKLHLIRMHEPASSRPCHCPYPDCGKAFACKSELTRHCKIHQRKMR